MTKENKRMVVMGGSFNPPTVVLAPAILPYFAKQMNGLGNTLLIFGKHTPDFGLLFCIWNRQNMQKN